MEKLHQTNSKVVLTLKNDRETKNQKRSSAYAFVKRSLSLLLGQNVPDTLYLGGDRDLVIRYIAHLINTSSFEVDVVNETTQFMDDPDFES
jgi:hypothetical protein